MTRQTAGLSRHAFSLIEVVVAVVILSILAALIVPRMAALTGRKTRAAVETLAQVVSAAAARSQMTSECVALKFDGEAGRLSMETRRAVIPDSLRSGSTVWREDPLVGAVSPEGVEITGVYTDNVPLNPRSWRVEFPQGERRPTLTVEVSPEGSEERWFVVLLPNAPRAVVLPPGSEPARGEEVDLDGRGGVEQPW